MRKLRVVRLGLMQMDGIGFRPHRMSGTDGGVLGGAFVEEGYPDGESYVKIC